MKEFKGTPGPWDFRQDVVNTGFYIETVDQSHKNTFIGDVGGGMQDQFEIRANAQLIATSPDLLHALQVLVGDIERHPVRLTREEKLEIARKAINKALNI